jgi:hypothetical protein
MWQRAAAEVRPTGAPLHQRSPTAAAFTADVGERDLLAQLAADSTAPCRSMWMGPSAATGSRLV